MAEVTGVVLAAGSGSRLGRPKAELVVAGVRLLDRAVRELRAAGCTEVVAVVRAGTRVDGAIEVVNPEPDRGMGSSLRLALNAAPGERVAIVLVDTPGIGADSIRRVLDIDAPFVIARYGARRGHPVAIERALWAEVAALAEGDQGARPFMQAHPDLVTEVAGTGDPSDIDTPDDLAAWTRRDG
ncbi:MAG TPA: nucleotidyltransferase family protein [Jatrophihabitantaceae bacterium]|jgi:molybdenum cofactor cytidylyltransferase/nicotine blue oxidoreductase